MVRGHVRRTGGYAGGGAVRRSLPPALAALVGIGLVVAAAGGMFSSTPKAARPASSTQVAALQSAAQAMEQAASFDYSVVIQTGKGSTSVHGTFEAPDREEMYLSAPGVTATEVLFAGSQVWLMTPGGTWAQQSAATATATVGKPTTFFSALASVENVNVVPNQGVFGQRLQFTLPASAAASLLQGTGSSTSAGIQGTATLSSGLLDGLTFTIDNAGTPVTIDVSYSAVGSAAPVQLPAGATA